MMPLRIRELDDLLPNGERTCQRPLGDVHAERLRRAGKQDVA